MPDAKEGDPHRIVVDESGFDFRGLSRDELADHLDDFNDALDELLSAHQVAVSPWWGEQLCTDDLELCQFLYDVRSSHGVSPDIRRRLGLLLDRCRTWDVGPEDDFPDEVHIAGSASATAWSVGYALSRTLAGFCIACLVFPAVVHRGWVEVSGAPGTVEMYFFGEASGLLPFWRALFEREDVPESAFFDRALDAFPALVLAPGLSFRRFDGTYREMRSWVVKVLGVLNDHFERALTAHSGQPSAVQAELGAFGVDLSPESPNTRAKPRIVRQRDVQHDGEVYRCEWHAKKDPHRNRVHFSLPEQRLEGKIFIGIFVDHLDT